MSSTLDLMSKNEMQKDDLKLVPAIGREVFLFLIVFFLFFGSIGMKMGVVNMISTLMKTAYDLTINVCFYIMAISVLSGAFGGVLGEFGVIALLDRLLSYLMKPLYNLPGAASIGILSCYLSDNPAIMTLARDPMIMGYFEKYQLPSFMNLGTSFGMGMIITTTMMGLPIEGSILAAGVGNIGAAIGSVVSVRIMMIFSKRYFGIKDSSFRTTTPHGKRVRTVRKGSIFNRVMDSLITGGKNGVELGLNIIPGVVIVCSLMFLLTNGVGDDGYTGGLGEGVGLLTWIGESLKEPLRLLFGFSSPEAIAVPIMALGSSGAAIGLVPDMVSKGIINANDLAVFTAFTMCWSGFLSTRQAMMEAIDLKELTGKSIIAHAIGGITSGVCANIIFKLIMR